MSDETIPGPVVDNTYKQDISDESASAGGDQVKATLDAAGEQGYIGFNPDPTPMHHYSVAGVTQGLPTPETDPDMAARAHESVRGGAFSSRGGDNK